MIGQLFTQDFLGTGITESPAWRSVGDVELDDFVSELKAIYVRP